MKLFPKKSANEKMDSIYKRSLIQTVVKTLLGGITFPRLLVLLGDALLFWLHRKHPLPEEDEESY